MNYIEARDTVLQELQTVFTNVKEAEVVALAEAICDAETVFVVGVGRVLLMLQGICQTAKPPRHRSDLCRCY
ncbi:MAG: hypothetical protein ACLTDX_24100 [[Clostridium] innocuum]